MIYLLIINPVVLLLVYILYATLECRKQADKLGKVGIGFYYLVTAIGALLDFIVNITWFTVIFWEWPREWLLTKRVERLKKADGYRGKLALFICSLLNRFLLGHCK